MCAGSQGRFACGASSGLKQAVFQQRLLAGSGAGAGLVLLQWAQLQVLTGSGWYFRSRSGS